MKAPDELFNFITDARFRSTLESDYREMLASLNSECWKAVHVLAGSIIEAMLTDYLLAIGHSQPDPLTMGLASIVAACKASGVITPQSEQLTAVVRNYRNLIHPGKTIREEQSIDDDSANVAARLVSMIATDLANEKRKTYGATAEQIISKVLRDPQTTTLGALLKKARPIELRRLLLELLPERYAQATEHEDTSGFRSCFDSAFEIAPDDTKRLAAKAFVYKLEHDDARAIASYQDRFFRCSQLEHLDAADQNTVKTHLLTEFANDEFALRFLHGIGRYLTEGEVKGLVFSLIINGDQKNKERFRSFLWRECKGDNELHAEAALVRMRSDDSEGRFIKITDYFLGKENDDIPF